MYQNFRPRSFSFIPVAVKNLLIINGLFYLATLVFYSAFQVSLINILGLHYWTSPQFEIYQVISHMFMHSMSPMHLLSNMFALWMFGTALENVWGPKKFIFFYIFTALGAAVLYQTVVGIELYRFQAAIDAFIASPTGNNYINAIKASGFAEDPTNLEIIKSKYIDGTMSGIDLQVATGNLKSYYLEKLNIPTVGASGAVFGVLVAFAMYFPNTEIIFLFFPFPIKAKYFVAIYALLELYLGIQNNPGDNVAHFAHLGGALFGFLLIKYWNKSNRRSLY